VRTIQGLDLDADLDRFLRLEASGWKGREGTAVLQDPAARRLYTGFAHAAAAAGWLRLRFLELDGATLAADFSCVLGRSEFLLKTCFDEDSSQLGPGVVLRAAVLRSAIDDGLARYEFLGGPERYKVRWGGELRRITGVLAYRRTRLPEYLYFHKLRVGVARLIARRRTGEPSQDQ
jgi:CelD/BcsL family acetyltransferase involved in cellulose biosynthesis